MCYVNVIRLSLKITYLTENQIRYGLLDVKRKLALPNANRIHFNKWNDQPIPNEPNSDDATWKKTQQDQSPRKRNDNYCCTKWFTHSNKIDRLSFKRFSCSFVFNTHLFIRFPIDTSRHFMAKRIRWMIYIPLKTFYLIRRVLFNCTFYTLIIE